MMVVPCCTGSMSKQNGVKRALIHVGDPSKSAQDLPPGSLSWTLSCDDEYIVTAFQQPAHRPCWGYRVREADRWVPHVGCFTAPVEPFCDPVVLLIHAVAQDKKLYHAVINIVNLQGCFSSSHVALAGIAECRRLSGQAQAACSVCSMAGTCHGMHGHSWPLSEQPSDHEAWHIKVVQICDCTTG